jgi:hypothetical protein
VRGYCWYGKHATDNAATMDRPAAHKACKHQPISRNLMAGTDTQAAGHNGKMSVCWYGQHAHAVYVAAEVCRRGCLLVHHMRSQVELHCSD